MRACVLPPGHKSQVGEVLAGKPQWSTCHGVTSPVAVICVCVHKKGREIGREEGCWWLKHWTVNQVLAPLTAELCFSSRVHFCPQMFALSGKIKWSFPGHKAKEIPLSVLSNISNNCAISSC